MSILQRIGEHVFEARTRWLWLDDFLDLLWSGPCYHVDVLCPPDEQADVLPYANWLRGQGDWSLRLVPEPAVRPMDMVMLAYRGSGLFRWGKWIEYTVMERSGAPFNPESTMEA